MTFNPQSPFKKVLRTEVEACQWTGDNLDEMKQLLAPYVEGNEEGPYVYEEHIEPYFYSNDLNSQGYCMLKFYAGDDMEVDPGQWVVVYQDGEIEIMNDRQYTKMGFK